MINILTIFPLFFRYSHKDNLILNDEVTENAVIESLKGFKAAGTFQITSDCKYLQFVLEIINGMI